MSDAHCEADYVVIGAGAVGMAFTDVMVSDSEASIAIVDKRAHPGGHWNDAYSFVRLHAPAAYYGVNSKLLGRGQLDDSGPNAGLYELASGDEVRAYFDQVMRDEFLASGRVRYFPMSEYSPNGQVTSLVTGEHIELHARKRVVDASYLGSEVPSTHRPTYTAAPGTSLIPVNDLTNIDHPHAGYVIIGSGKTGVDACLWLLGQGLDPSLITWVRPRDAWFVDRANVQGGEDFLERTLGSFATQLEVMAQAESVEDLFVRLEGAGQLLRIDEDCWPTMFRYATVTGGELEALRQVKHVVRLGHVVRLDRNEITLEGGNVSTAPDSLYIDCSAAGLRNRPPVPVFDDRRITLQYVIYGAQPTYSATLIAFVELEQLDDDAKNLICHPIPVSGELTDVPRNMLLDMNARRHWSKLPSLRDRMVGSRLDPVMGAASRIDHTDPPKLALMKRYRENTGPARLSLEKLIADSYSEA